MPQSGTKSGTKSTETPATVLSVAWYAYIRYRESDPEMYLDGDSLYVIADELGVAEQRLAERLAKIDQTGIVSAKIISMEEALAIQAAWEDDG